MRQHLRPVEIDKPRLVLLAGEDEDVGGAGVE